MSEEDNSDTPHGTVTERARMSEEDDSDTPHGTVTERAWMMICKLRLREPHKKLVVLGDGGYDSLDLMASCQSMRNPVTLITRARMNMAMYEPAPARSPGQKGRPRKKGRRKPSLGELLESDSTPWTPQDLTFSDGTVRTMEIASGTAVRYVPGKSVVYIRWVLIRDPSGELKPQILQCTDLEASPAQIASWYAQRWQVEVTFREVRDHLGVETQRQWSDPAIDRTTPILMGLFSWVTLVADMLSQKQELKPRQAAWYDKKNPTFRDALAAVRTALWPAACIFSASGQPPETKKMPVGPYERLLHAMTYA